MIVSNAPPQRGRRPRAGLGIPSNLALISYLPRFGMVPVPDLSSLAICCVSRDINSYTFCLLMEMLKKMDANIAQPDQPLEGSPCLLNLD